MEYECENDPEFADARLSFTKVNKGERPRLSNSLKNNSQRSPAAAIDLWMVAKPDWQSAVKKANPCYQIRSPQSLRHDRESPLALMTR